jgi:hypothetical protein
VCRTFRAGVAGRGVEALLHIAAQQLLESETLAGCPGLQAGKQRIRQLQGGAHHNLATMCAP